MKYFKKLFSAFGASAVFAFSFFQQAYAALPEGVTKELESAKSDGVAVAGLVLGVIIAIAAFKYVRRAL